MVGLEVGEIGGEFAGVFDLVPPGVDQLLDRLVEARKQF